MKKTVNKKVLLSVLSLMLIVAMAFSACGQKDSNVSNSTTTTTTTANADSEAVTELGQGEKTFTFEVVEKDGSKKSYEISTDAKTVGEALVENGLISGTDSEYGLMVDTVNGQKYEYNADKMYWAFYINGDYGMTGVDSTEIDETAVYSFVATKA
jgi:uncharacterized protein YxeA